MQKKQIDLKLGSHLPKKIGLFAFFESPLKNGEKCFLFDLKIYSHSQDISVFDVTFSVCRRTAWLERQG